MSRSMRVPCGECRWFQPSGTQDSGITAVDGNGNWFYAVGACAPPVRQLDTPRTGDLTPEWGTCSAAKARPARRHKATERADPSCPAPVAPYPSSGEPGTTSEQEG